MHRCPSNLLPAIASLNLKPDLVGLTRFQGKELGRQFEGAGLGMLWWHGQRVEGKCDHVLSGDIKPECNQNTGQLGARYHHFPSWHQPFLTTWLLLDKESVWNKLSADQKKIILTVAKKSLADSFAAANAHQCSKLQAMLDLNNEILQRNRETGEPGKVSADIVMTDWPQDALDTLLEARQAYLDKLRGAGVKEEEKTDNQKTADAILSDLEAYGASIGATKPMAAHGVFPVNDSALTFNGEKAATCAALVGR